jgi:23S rRNA pseudouridine1911/1915/1917 synthase
VKPGYHVRAGNIVEFEIPSYREIRLEPEDIPLDIVFEDDSLMVVNKPAGMVVHPGSGIHSGTMANALLAHCGKLSSLGGPIRPGIVHRLDKDTSGILMVAKDNLTHNALSEQLQQRSIKREYVAVVWASPGMDRGEIDAPIGRDRTDRKKMSVVGVGSRDAATSFSVLERYDIASLLSLKLKTGRTHQIRVHMSYLGYPVFGDPRYGGRTKALKSLSPSLRRRGELLLGLISRQALHATKLGFLHPESGEYLEFSSKVPEDMQNLLDRLRSGC